MSSETDVPTVELTGGALFGCEPEHLTRSTLGVLASAAAVEVRLGRRPPEFAEVDRPQLVQFFNPGLMRSAPPLSVDYGEKAKASLGRMYLNDRYGDCVVAGKAHALGVWTANDSDAGGEVQATDQEVLDQYRRWCGPGDNGCVITRVLDRMKAEGLQAGGRKFKLDGYAAVDWTNPTLVRAAIAAFGSLALGINLPQSWTNAAVWDVTNSRIVGGHDVTAIGYDERGVKVSSWGRVYLITWRAFTSRTWLEECYALLAPSWYNADGLAPSGFDVAGLKKALDAVGGGELPPDPTPTPPVPPTPPAPGTQRYTISGVFEGTVTPPAPPAVEARDEVTFDCRRPRVASLLVRFCEHRDVEYTVDGTRLTVRRGKISPEQWAAIIQAIAQILLLIIPLFA